MLSSSDDRHRHQEEEDDQIIRDIHIHALTPTPPPVRARPNWEASSSSHRSSSLSVTSSTEENFSSMSHEFNALVLAGSTIANNEINNNNNSLARIGEEDRDMPSEEMNPLAIVPDTSGLMDPVPSPRRNNTITSASATTAVEEITMQRVKREEVEAKIAAWQTAKVAKINNRFKREDAIINGWEGEQLQKATSLMKKTERKLEEKRAKAMEKMQNEVAKAHRKAEERRASAEAKRGTKVARVLEISNLMRALGRPPVKRSFF